MVLSIIGVIFTLGILLFTIPFVFYLLTLQNTFNEICEENRKIRPGQVWLTLIPIFGLFWQFVIVYKMAISLREELSKRNIKVEEKKPGLGVGLASGILIWISIIILGVLVENSDSVSGIFLLVTLTSFGGFICWLLYWSKILGYKRKLQQNQNILSNHDIELILQKLHSEGDKSKMQ